jgi:hypothetical protein
VPGARGRRSDPVRAESDRDGWRHAGVSAGEAPVEVGQVEGPSVKSRIATVLGHGDISVRRNRPADERRHAEGAVEFAARRSAGRGS